MDSKLKSVRAGHKGAVTKLLVKFDELKSNTNTEVDEVKALDDAVTQKQKTLIDLNNRLLDQTSEENLEQEITDSDEYIYELDWKLRQIRKFIKSLESNTKMSHDSVEPSTCKLNAHALNFTPEVRVDMNTCAIDSMNQQFSIHAPAVHTRPSENIMYQVPSEPISAAEVRTKSGCFSRPIVKLYPLEMCENIHSRDTRDTQQPGTSNIQRRLPFREAAVCARRNIHEWTKR
ncbi:unnamed protein product [Mytilus coruscus]|uniref:Uncharacterized protein n=1 Tax=Mytilus coruscus TaxID=42192 RepID=A0A6J8BZR2_MYTCO|nr:unnamed protein product [Mytilus coruscus]